jgi:tRNA (adenine37-N6)-methyltransferase
MPMDIIMQPIATVHNTRVEPTDDFWGSVVTEITLASHIPEDAFTGIEDFSHLEIIFYFDKADDGNMFFHSHPRGNKIYPKVGIFAQRKKDRPNKIGLCTVELLARNGKTIIVRGLDAINDTPVLDIKPVLKEFETKGDIHQPSWATDLMTDYWK